MLKLRAFIASDNFYSLAHQLTMAAYGAVLMVLLYRLLSAQDVGNWIIFISLVSLFDMLQHGLQQTFVVKQMSVATSKNEFQKLVSTTLAVALLLYAAIVSVLFLAKWSGHFWGNGSVYIDLLCNWYPFLGIFMIVYNVSWWINIGRSRFDLVWYKRLVYVAVSLIVLFLVYLYDGNLTFFAVALSQVLGYAIAGFVALIWLYPAQPRGLLFDKILAGKIWNYGKFTSLTMLGGSLLRSADTFMIAGFLSNTAVATYAIAQKCIELFEVPLRGLATAALPQLNSAAQSDIWPLAKRKIIFITSFFIPMAVVMFIFSNTIVSLFAGSGMQYPGAALVLKVMLVYILLLPTDRIIGVVLEAKNLPQSNLFKTVILVSFNVLGNFIGLYFCQSIAIVALTSIVAMAIAIAFGYIILNRKPVVVSAQ